MLKTHVGGCGFDSCCFQGFWILSTANVNLIVLDLSLKMSESKESSTLSELEMNELPQGSPDEVIKDAPAPARAQGQWMCNIKRCMFLILLVISSTILIAQINAADSDDPPIIPPQDFTFLVYCPYSFKDKARPVLFDDTESGELRRRRLYQAYSYSVQLLHPETLPEHDWTHTYVVEMQSRKVNETVNFYYCGLVTNFGSTCDEDVFQACSSPGPMFDLRTSQHSDIIWVNNLNPSNFVNDSCMTIESKDPHCKLMSKSEITRTYVDPTDQHSNEMTQITPDRWPVTAHVHGSQVRPTFDGNPLSWIANDGSRGVGAFSLSDRCYYDAFDLLDSSKNYYMPPEVIVKRRTDNEKDVVVIPQAKVNRYPNIQNPGNLWYHDHAMRLTLYNVQYGLSGLFMLRDPIVEAQIGVSIKNEKLVMMTTNGWKATQNLESASDVVYRFRFLNNNFNNNNVFRIFFTYETCSNAKTLVPFTIIGADSSLFNEGIYDQTSFIIAQAERMEILIKFDGNQKSYSICSPVPTDPFPPVAKAARRQESATLREVLIDGIEAIRLISGMEYKFAKLNTRKDIAPVSLTVPFVNFSDTTAPIAVKRMRPLMRINGIFSINGRLDFHAGKSENPTIGTYEDWYLINLMGGSHPIHVHLINFQVIKILSLRKTSGGCNVYELDFIVAAMKAGQGTSFLNNTKYFPDPNNLNNVSYNAICTDMATIYKSPEIIERLDLVNVQDEVDVEGVSGINVEKLLTPYEKELFANQSISTDGGNGKYVTNETNEVKSYYRRWKDTASVDGGKVFVYRMRWAKSSYRENVGDTPFHVPVDQLREYPGFVYHCHILFHEDNEMMRPIMLQLPNDTKLNPETPCNNVTDYSWATKVNCINDRCIKA